ncbi:MAG TPA: hypothetical protein VFV99_31270 [Kofleriaceae bacterium]|nr:hypothetical protein [Kofleriaceae bacterium]
MNELRDTDGRNQTSREQRCRTLDVADPTREIDRATDRARNRTE